MLGPRGLIGVGVVTVLAAGSVAAVSRGSDGEARARPGVASEWRPPTVSSLTTLPAAPVAAQPGGEPEAAAVGLQRFSDCGSLLDRVRSAVLSEVTPWLPTQPTVAGTAGTAAGSAPMSEASSGTLPPDIAVLHDRRADRRITIHSGGLDQLLHEFVDLDR